MRYDSKFIQVCHTLTDLFVINMIHVLCCLPIFTIGAAMAALNTCTLKMVRDEETAPIRREYFRAFKNNFKKATALWLIILLFIVFLYLDFRIATVVESAVTQSFLFGLLIVALVILVCVISYLFPLVAWFENSIRNHLMNSLRLSFGRFRYTILLVVMNISPFLILLVPWKAMIWMLAVDLFIWFSGVSYLNARMLRSMFDDLAKSGKD